MKKVMLCALYWSYYYTGLIEVHNSVEVILGLKPVFSF